MALLNAASLAYESAQSQQAFAALADSGDHLKYTLAASKPWSRAAGYEPVFAPYGLMTGGVVTPAAALGNNNVDVAALTAMMPAATGASATTGVLSVSAAVNQACTRGASTNTHIVNSITITSAGAVAVVAGTAAPAPFVETRGAGAGPPFIPVGSIEIAQVRFTSITAAVVQASEILQVVGLHQERYDYPAYTPDYLGGTLTFSAALPLIHTGSVTKLIYARVATPIFADIARSKDWQPAETTNSASSVQYYDGAVGSFASSLGQASFTMVLNDGSTDPILSAVGKNLLFRFKPDRNKTPYQLTQGVLAMSRTYNVGTSPVAAMTVTSDQQSVDYAL